MRKYKTKLITPEMLDEGEQCQWHFASDGEECLIKCKIAYGNNPSISEEV